VALAGDPRSALAVRRSARPQTIRGAFEAAGVEFMDENGGGPGFRPRKRQSRGGENRGEGLRNEPNRLYPKQFKIAYPWGPDFAERTQFSESEHQNNEARKITRDRWQEPDRARISRRS